MSDPLSRRTILAGAAASVAIPPQETSDVASPFLLALDRPRRALAACREAGAEYDRIADQLEREGTLSPRALFQSADDRYGIPAVYCYSHAEIDNIIDARLRAFGGPKFWTEAERERIVPSTEGRRAMLHAELSAAEAHCRRRRDELGEPAADLAMERTYDEVAETFYALLRTPVETIEEARALAAWVLEVGQHSALVGDAAGDALRAIAGRSAGSTSADLSLSGA